MKNKAYKPYICNYLLFTAAATAGIGVILLFWPESILQWFIPGATGHFFIRFIGSALMGYAALNVMAALARDAETQRIALWSNLVTLSIATVLSIYGVASNQIQSMASLIIVEHILFTVGFATCLFLEYKR